MARKTLLIIEDEEHIANAEKMILEGDFDVHIANDGKEGYKKAMEIKPDIIVLDLMLPGMNGYDVCKKLRNSELMSNTKIVMVTAKDQDKDEVVGMDLGADDYIMKPFEPVELMHVVNQVLKY